MQVAPGGAAFEFGSLGCVVAIHVEIDVVAGDLHQRPQKIPAQAAALPGVFDGNGQDLGAENGWALRGTIQADEAGRLRAEVARLRGQDEVLARDVSDIQRHQKDLQQGIDERVRKLEPQSVTLDGKAFTADVDEKREFDEALARMRRADFAGGAADLNAFLKKYPATGYKESALYWLGNAHYGLRDYKESISRFRALLAMAPQHMRAPEALLSIANCHSELKETKAARKTLEDLVKAYPDAEAAQVARERLAAAAPR